MDYPIVKYINNNRKYFKRQFPEFIYDMRREELIRDVRTFNLERLNNEKNTELWEVPFFSTTDDEENDTDDEEEDTINKNPEFKKLRDKEN